MTYEAKIADCTADFSCMPLTPTMEKTPPVFRIVHSGVGASANKACEPIAPINLEWVESIVKKLARKLKIPRSLFGEILSEGYLAFFEADKRYDKERNPNRHGFLHTRIRGAVIDYLRKNLLHESRVVSLEPGSHTKVGDNDVSNSFGSDFSGVLNMPKNATTKDPESILLQMEVSTKLQKMIRALPKRERAVIINHYFREKSLVEIGEENGHGKSYVSALRRQALIRLKHQYLRAMKDE